MFTKEELLVIEDALNIADEKYIKLMEESRNNKNKLVAYNRKQKKLWLVQNKLNKIRDVFKIIMIHPLNIIEIELLLHHQLDK